MTRYENCRKADEIIRRIRERLDYQKYLTPLNYQEENNRFLAEYEAGRVYQPRYRYEPFQEDLEPEWQELSEIPLGDRGMEALFAKERSAVRSEAALYESIGTEAFTRQAIRIHGKPDVQYYREALAAAEAPGEPAGGPELGAEALKEIFEKRMADYGFDWKILVKPNMASKVSVEPERKEILINGKKRFSKKDGVRLCAHEIDTHVLRSENGRRRPFALFASGTAGSLLHEEGLALYNEKKRGVMDPEMLRLYAGRFISCLYLEESSFYQTFERLIRLGYAKEQAMYITGRVKRGLTDTGKGGGFIKDYVYFQGYREVTEAVQKDPGLYRKLYYGSISLGNTEELSEEIDRAEAEGTILLPLLSNGGRDGN